MHLEETSLSERRNFFKTCLLPQLCHYISSWHVQDQTADSRSGEHRSNFSVTRRHMLKLSTQLDVTLPDPVVDGGAAAARKEGQPVDQNFPSSAQQHQRSPPHRSASVPVITARCDGYSQEQQQGGAPAEEEGMRQQGEGEPPARAPAAHAQQQQQLPSHDYECSICHDIIFNPVVGEC